MTFNMSSEKDILNGDNADIYFKRALKILESENIDDSITAEVTVSSFENPWVTFSGLDEIISLLKGKNIDLFALPEGTIIPYRDVHGTPVPFISVRGKYRDIGLYETSLLGFICQSSGISTAASLVRIACGDKPFFSFGIRRMHPSIAPMIDRAAYIGGADGVSGSLGARILGIEPVGTMPHALSLLLGDEKAWKSVASQAKGATVLIDTYDDEKFGALKAAGLLSNLKYVRLDTPSSRRGNFANIIREVRWELDLRGFKDVKIMVSGGLTPQDIVVLRNAGADSFGVGTSIASGKTVDFSMDIVEIAGKPITKKGKFSSRKDVLRCNKCHSVLVIPDGSRIPQCECSGSYESLLIQYLRSGTVSTEETPAKARDRAMAWIHSTINKDEPGVK